MLGYTGVHSFDRIGVLTVELIQYNTEANIGDIIATNTTVFPSNV